MKSSKLLFLVLVNILYVTCLSGFAQSADIMDSDSNFYQTIKIGDQVWMKENLKVKHYRNGDPIRTTAPEFDVWDLKNPDLQWSIWGDIKTINVYGRLYTWYAATDPRCLCPKEWHVPTNEDWRTLIKYLGGQKTAGGKMKEVGKKFDNGEGTNQVDNDTKNPHWCDPNTGATNSSKFTARPSGRRVIIGFGNQCYEASFWSSTIKNGPWYLGLGYGTSSAFLETAAGLYGYSIRCVKDRAIIK